MSSWHPKLWALAKNDRQQPRSELMLELSLSLLSTKSISFYLRICVLSKPLNFNSSHGGGHAPQNTITMPFPISTTTRPDRRRRHASTPTRLLLSLSLLTATTATRSHQPDLNYRTHCTPQMPQGLLPPHLFTCPLPMTTAPSNPLALSPWTHPPLCVSAAPGKQLKDPHLKTGWVDTRSNKTDQYCVYTNARHGLGGLSIITTPEAAAQITAVVNEMPLDPLAWEPSVAESFNLTDSTRGKRERQPFKIGPIEGKGLGVVATRFIPRMTPIATDYASLVLDLRFPEVVPRKAGYGVLHAAADRLIEPHKKVYGLGRGGNKFAEDVVEDVVRTNAFHAELMGGMYGALFPMISVSDGHGIWWKDVIADELRDRDSTMRVDRSKSSFPPGRLEKMSLTIHLAPAPSHVSNLKVSSSASPQRATYSPAKRSPSAVRHSPAHSLTPFPNPSLTLPMLTNTTHPRPNLRPNNPRAQSRPPKMGLLMHLRPMQV